METLGTAAVNPYTTSCACLAACMCRSGLLEERGHGILLPPEKLATGSSAPLSAADGRSVTLLIYISYHVVTKVHKCYITDDGQYIHIYIDIDIYVSV